MSLAGNSNFWILLPGRKTLSRPDYRYSEDYNLYSNPFFFTKSCLRLGADCSLRILYKKTLFSLSRLKSRVVHCNLSNTSAELVSNFAPVMTRTALFCSTWSLFLRPYHMCPRKESNNQNMVELVLYITLSKNVWGQNV